MFTYREDRPNPNIASWTASVCLVSELPSVQTGLWRLQGLKGQDPKKI